MAEKINIVGAGLVGTLLGINLKKKGFDVSIYEKRPDPRNTPHYEGRSINLALSHRGIRALEAVAIFDKIAPVLIPMKGRMMHNAKGALTYQPYGKEGEHIYSVPRGYLNKCLLAAAEEMGIEVKFGKRCEHVDFEESKLYFDDQTTATSEVLFGTDGAFSAIRKEMQRTDRFNFSQHYIGHGYKELKMPSVKGEFALDPDYLHIWPRGHFMLIALPNHDKTFTCTLFFPYEGDPSFRSLVSEEDIQLFFEEYFPDVFDLIPDCVRQYLTHPVSSLVTIRCEPWCKHNTLLLGDAAHAIVPFYGQGMNSGFEDVRLFIDHAEKRSWDWTQILPQYAQARKKDADAISTLALDNFVEMRDHVGDPNFLKRKALEAELQVAYPEDWIPLYSMVTFTDMPYSEALRLGKIQKEIMDRVILGGEDLASEDIIRQFNALK